MVTESQLVMNDAGCRRQKVIRRLRHHNQGIDGIGCPTEPIHRTLCGSDTEIAATHAVSGEASSRDSSHTGHLADFLLTEFTGIREVIEPPGWHAGADCGDACARCLHYRHLRQSLFVTADACMRDSRDYIVRKDLIKVLLECFASVQVCNEMQTDSDAFTWRLITASVVVC